MAHVIKHLRDGVFLISDILKDPNSADKTVTIDLTMQTRTLWFYYISDDISLFFLQRWRYLLNPDPKSNPVTNLLISVDWWFDRFMSLSNSEKHFRWPHKLVFSKSRYIFGDILKYLALTNIAKHTHNFPSQSKIIHLPLTRWVSGFLE